MIDSIIETYPEGEVPKELEQRKVEILSQVFVIIQPFNFRFCVGISYR